MASEVKQAPQVFVFDELDKAFGSEHDDAVLKPKNVLRKELKKARKVLAKDRSLWRPGWDLEAAAGGAPVDPGAVLVALLGLRRAGGCAE